MNITKRNFDNTGLSMSILRVGDKSPVQTVFFCIYRRQFIADPRVLGGNVSFL